MTPQLVKYIVLNWYHARYTNELLYYAVVIMSPFVSHVQREHMQDYILSAKRAMYGDTSEVRENCLLCSTNTLQIGYSEVNRGLQVDLPSADHPSLRSR